MPLILGTTPQTNLRMIRNLCEQAGWTLSSERPETWYQSDKAQLAIDDRVLLLHSHPEEAIAYAMAEGRAPEMALREWVTAAQAMVNFYKCQRKQAVMVFLPHLLDSPEAKLEAIASQLGLFINQFTVTEAQGQEVPLLEQMMARQLLRQTPEVSHVLAQIEACTLPRQGHSYQAPELDIHVANQYLITLRSNLREREQRVAELQEKLVQTENQLQGQESAKRKVEKVLQQMEQQDHSAELKCQQQKSQEENNLLLEQLHLVEEELENQFINRQKLETELIEFRHQQDRALEAANHQIKRLQTELNNFKSSPAWKATAPVRALKKPFRGNTAKKAVKKQAELVRQSGMFNEGWYLKSYPDVAENGADPIEHYLKFGAEERRNPSPEFDTEWYLTNYPDVAQEGINPLVHYIKFGQNEGRAINVYHHPSLPAPGAV